MLSKQFFTPVTSINSLEAKKLVADEGADNVTFLDVRQPREYEASHIPGSKLIPMGQLDTRLDELDPEKPVVVY
jgi:rhodanese-related sulfurtransferase